MAAARICPELHPAPRPDFQTWLREVRTILLGMNTDMDEWQSNWAFDFRREYDAGAAAVIAAAHAHSFWWQELLAESWT